MNLLTRTGRMSTVALMSLLLSSITDADTFQLQPQRMIADVRSEGVGECILEMPNSPAGLFVNPGATSVIYRPKVSLMDVSFPENVRYRAGGVGFAAKYGNISAMISNLNYGDVKNYTVGTKTYSLGSSGDVNAAVNYSLLLRRELPYPEEYGSAGISVKYLRSTVGDLHDDNIALDIGGSYNIPAVNNLSAGLVYRNVGTSAKFINDTFPLISEVEVGIRYDIPSLGGLHLLADGGRNLTEGLNTVAVGVGVAPVFPFTFRAGWRDNGQPSGSGFRGGVGLDAGAISINYAFAPYIRGQQGAMHYIDLDVSFGGIADEKRAYDYYLKQHFAVARNKYERKDYIGARQELEDILSVYPDDQLSKEYLEKIGQALDDIEQIRDVEINRWLRRAVVATSEKDYIRAQRCYNHILKIEPGNVEAQEGQAKLDRIIGEAKKVNSRKENYEKLVVMFNDALALYQRGEYVVAKEKFQAFLEIDPDNEQAKKYVQEIDTQMAKVTAIQINNLFIKGMGFYNMGDYREAMKYFSAVAIASPDRLDAQDYLAKCQNILKQEEEKLNSAEVVQRQEKIKEEVESAFARAVKLYDAGSFEEALKAFAKSREVAARYDNDKYVEESRSYIAQTKNAISEKHFKMGFDYAQRNKIESAAYEYRKALEYNADNTSARVELDQISGRLAQDYYEEGMNYFSKGNAEKAKELFKKSLYYKPEKIESLRALERIR